jgi:predicted esterase
MTDKVHQDLPVLESGDALADTSRIIILLHGRGATADSMLGLAQSLYTRGSRFLLPQAAQNRWYPQTAFGPLEPNQPDLSSALNVVDGLVAECLALGFSKEQILLGGFSQGACLAAEYLARNPDRMGGLFVFSGALIGPPGEPRQLEGDLKGTPVFIGGSDIDPWVGEELFHEAQRVFSSLGGEVDLVIYPGMGHQLNDDEIKRVKKIISGV